MLECVCVYSPICMWVPTGTRRCYIVKVVNYLMRLLGTELESSARVVSTLNG